MLYELRDDFGNASDPFPAASDEEALEAAPRHLGDWPDPDAEGRTVWAVEQLWRTEPAYVGEVTQARHPALTCAAGGEHRWIEGRRLRYLLLGGSAQEPGVWGSGGGVQLSEVCARCGVQVTRDTWCTCGQLAGDPHECRWVVGAEETRRALEEAQEAEPVLDLLRAEIARGPAEFLEDVLSVLA